MNIRVQGWRPFVASALAATVLAGCAQLPGGPSRAPASGEVHDTAQHQFQIINRLTWGASAAAARDIAETGATRFIEAQLHPSSMRRMPAEVQAQIDAMTISQRPATDLVLELEQRRREADAIADPEQKKAAQQTYQQEVNRLANETATRFVLRALYSPDQLREQMTWFWMNHFNVFQYKSDIRRLLADYEEHAIRANALGKFRDLVTATAHHPAMLRYLDNEQNAAGRINENYARELMELHTLGVNGGYTQTDVQELARILTGLGVNVTQNKPNVRPQLQSEYVRDGLFEFNPARHDYGDKTLLGSIVRGRGLAEVDEAIDRLVRHPSTARFICRKLAVYLVADEPPASLVESMAQVFRTTDGDIAAVLRTLFASREFAESLGRKFKDPVHYVLSAVRFAYDDKVILNAGPIVNWLNRMSEPVYGRQTPDGYPLVQSAWASPGQMTTRFEIARALGSGSAGLFKSAGPQPVERAAFPQLANALYYKSLEPTLSNDTRGALTQANSPQEWNTFLLSSPEFMYR